MRPGVEYLGPFPLLDLVGVLVSPDRRRTRRRRGPSGMGKGPGRRATRADRRTILSSRTQEFVAMRIYAGFRKGQGHRRHASTGCLIVAMGLAMAGCGHSDSLPALEVYQVKGKLLLADGKPLSGGWIYLVPKGDLPLTPGRPVGNDGTFSVVTGGSGEGATPGEYKLRIETPQFQASGKQKPLIPQKYTDEDSSGLVVTVRAEVNQLEPIRLR